MKAHGMDHLTDPKLCIDASVKVAAQHVALLNWYEDMRQSNDHRVATAKVTVSFAVAQAPALPCRRGNSCVHLVVLFKRTFKCRERQNMFR